MINATIPLVSVVVPVHEMAGRLSGLEQSIGKAHDEALPIEFILVQDGDDVGTSDELKHLAMKYRVRVLQTVVNSPGLTRNLGLDAASALWIAFWDSDDRGNPSNLIAAVRSSPSSANVVIGSFEWCDSAGAILKSYPCEESLEKVAINPGIWRFVFKHDYLANRRFRPFKMGEDQLFIADLALKEEEIHYSPLIIYKYTQNNGNQLTKQRSAIQDIQLSLNELDVRIAHFGLEKYGYILRARMALTAFKYSKITKTETLKLVLGPKNFNFQQRVKVISGFLRTAKILFFEYFR